MLALLYAALAWGDPHIKTLDGKSYTFNGIGEYVLLRDTQFELQARTKLVSDSTATVFSSAAMQQLTTGNTELCCHIFGQNIQAPCPVFYILFAVMLCLNFEGEIFLIEGSIEKEQGHMKKHRKS